MKALLVVTVLACLVLAPVALAPTASATHTCMEGSEALCTHPEMLFCVAPLHKWLGWLCPHF